jgi:hypothetical protein
LGLALVLLDIPHLLHKFLEVLEGATGWKDSSIGAWCVGNHIFKLGFCVRVAKVSRSAARVVRKAANQTVLALLVGDTYLEIKCRVDLFEKLINLALGNKNQRLR